MDYPKGNNEKMKPGVPQIEKIIRTFSMKSSQNRKAIGKWRLDAPKRKTVRQIGKTSC